jgi:hypothetical protein
MSQIKYRLSELAKEWAEFLARDRRKCDGTPILVTGVQRCGTTWMGQMLHVPGVRLYHEPLGKFGVLWNPSLLTDFPDGVDNEGLKEKLLAIGNGSEWRSYNKRHWNQKKRRVGRLSPVRMLGDRMGRPVIKDPTCVGMLEEVSKHFEFRAQIISAPLWLRGQFKTIELGTYSATRNTDVS